MKRLLYTLAALAVGSALQAQVANSPHDLSTTSTSGKGKTNTTQICVFCHTPHNAIGSVGGGNITAQLIPLWNHTATSGTFTMYNTTNNPGSNLQGVVDASVSGASLACLSCHDGTLAVGALANMPNDVTSFTYTAGGGLSTTGRITSGNALIGGDLTNDHPISITYNWGTGAGQDPELKNPSTFPAAVKLFSNKVQCASCHDAHNYGTTGAGTRPFLSASMNASALCLTCHTK